MGKYDKQLQWCREWHADSVADLKRFESGVRQWSGPNGTEEVTEQLKARAKRDIERSAQLIVAWEKINA
jgi:hypothetical protein